MLCSPGSYEVTTTFHDPYDWECRDFGVTMIDGEDSQTESTAECPTGAHISGCMCSTHLPERGCKGSFV